jgi:hypothetical protein
MIQDNEISPSLAFFLHEILRKDYCLPVVVELPSYSQQSIVVNNRIWKRLFSDSAANSHLVYLEFEKITHMLLEYDLCNRESLAFCVLFDPLLRETVFRELDGVKGCWDLKKLKARLRMDESHSCVRQAPIGCGTSFFWGINEVGRRVPLFLETGAHRQERLCGFDDRGRYWEIPYSGESILDALHENRLLPSLFTSFLVLSLARGIVCAGGYFQCEYLPIMQKGLVKALRQTACYQEIADVVGDIRTNTYLSGMQAVMTRINPNALIPAGPIEIFAAGGLTADDKQKILSLTVRDAHIASLFETIPDVAPRALRTADWKKQLAADVCKLLKDNVVIK